jgi:hypothetical protein
MTVKRIQRMCKRTGCTETWEATLKNKKRYCRDCIPQSSRGPKYPFRMQRTCLCGKKEIKKIHNEQERLAAFECKSCTKISTEYKWHEMQLLYITMLNNHCSAEDFVRQGVFKNWDEYNDFCKFLRDVMQIELHRDVIQIELHHKDNRTSGWTWGSLAKEHAIVKHTPIATVTLNKIEEHRCSSHELQYSGMNPGTNHMETLKDFLKRMSDRRLSEEE